MNICFDVDECLIKEGKPIESNIELLKLLSKNHKVYMWSGNGYEYSLKIAETLRLDRIISGVLDKYGTFIPDIAFDNQEIKLGKVDIRL